MAANDGTVAVGGAVGGAAGAVGAVAVALRQGDPFFGVRPTDELYKPSKPLHRKVRVGSNTVAVALSSLSSLSLLFSCLEGTTHRVVVVRQ